MNSTAVGSMATAMDTTLFWELFLQRLPSKVRIVLTLFKAALLLEQLTQLANWIVEALPTLATISAADTHSQLITQVMELLRFSQKPVDGQFYSGVSTFVIDLVLQVTGFYLQ